MRMTGIEFRIYFSVIAESSVVITSEGRGLFSKKQIKTGNVIFVENPLVCSQFSWNAAYGYRACHHCLKPLETAEENARRLASKPDLILPYPECCITEKSLIVSCNKCGLEYCSSECQTNAFNQYHKTICIDSLDKIHPLNNLNEAWKNIHYPPETSTVMIIPKIIATILQAPDKDAATSSFLNFCHRSVNEDAELAHKFLGEKYANQISLLHELLAKSVPNEGVEQFLTPAGFQSLLALIGTNGQGVGTSPISQWVTRSSELPLEPLEKEQLDNFIDKLYDDMDLHSGNFLNNEGVALYSTQTLCNHNCVPNAEPTFLHNNSTLSLVALRDIDIDEEISISYLDECSLQRSRHSRQKALKENYLFNCSCEKCISENDDPDVTSEEEMSE